MSDPSAAPMHVVQDRIRNFICPEGFELMPVPLQSAFRSAIYDYGVKCRHKATDKAVWFCVYDEHCHRTSLAAGGAEGGVRMSRNSSTNCITHLREYHQVSVGMASPRPPSAMSTEGVCSESSRAEDIEKFSPPAGYDKDPVPECSPSRSIMYSYGCKCTNKGTQDTRWFCFCNDVCSSRSRNGTHGISIRGNTSTNSIVHLRRVHGVTPTLQATSGQQRRVSKRKRADANALPLTSTPINLGIAANRTGRLSPLDVDGKSTDSDFSVSKVDLDGFRCPPGFVVDLNIRAPGGMRSNIYDYGVRCIATDTMELRWFCCADEVCRANSQAGIGGILMKGRATSNCSAHLKISHNILSAALRKKSQTPVSASSLSPFLERPQGSPEMFNDESVFKTPQCGYFAGDDFRSIGSPAGAEIHTTESELDDSGKRNDGDASVQTVRPRATFAGNRSLSFG